MRIPLPLRLPLALGVVAVCAISEPAHAQSFPGAATWVPVTRSGGIVADLADNPSAPEIDVIGDSSAANAAIRVHSDAGFLYFRLRVSADPRSAGAWKNNAWACAIDIDNVTSSYEFLAILDGSAAETVAWRWNAATGDGTITTDGAETLVASNPASTHAQSSTTTGGFFVDFAIPWATINAGGNGAPAVSVGAAMRFACGGVLGTTTAIIDPVAIQANVNATFAATFSDRYVCGSTGCLIDTDGDGVSDQLEIALGTNPNNVDTDGDGIPDNIELTPPGGGAYTVVNSDSDLVIDALDADSDNDCAPDAVEGVATFRNASLPNAAASANCAAATPVCVQSSGTCAACTTEFGGGVTACPSALRPSCQLSGALQGQCTQCKAGMTQLCSGATPACERTTGTCAACNGSFGSAATAACTNALVPACNLSGALAGRCTQCTATSFDLCTTDSPVCDAPSGQCAKCNGDRGSGAVRACPATSAPYCFATGVDFGKCGKCTSNAQCGAGHTGPTCDLATGACIDTDSDGDGLNDSVELLLGTNPLKKDSDDDGIPDLEEVTPLGGGAPTKVDTDGDLTIDALDPDSDGDGVPDSEERASGDAGVRDTDGDGIPDWRDPDDDGDGITTKDEIADTKTAKVSDDVDGDGKKNWFDDDADGDGTGDKTEGRGDDDSDGIPNYLDKVKGEPPPDGGPVKPSVPDASVVDAGGGSGDAGADGGFASPPEEGVLEGSSLCSTTTGAGSPVVLLGVSGVLLALWRRRRTRRTAP